MNKIFLSLVILITLTLVTLYPVLAQESPPPINGSLPPNYKLPSRTNPEYIEKLNQVQQNQLQAAPVFRKSLYVGTIYQFKEPEDLAYINYCGPASTQVALRARTTNIPSLYAVGQCELIDPNWGVYMSNVTPCLNDYLNTDFYWTDVASSKVTLANRLKSDVDQGYAMLTGVVTSEMGGWGDHFAYHIITLYGYDNTYNYSSDKMVYYVDTASNLAGYSGSYFHKVTLTDMWNYVSPNNVQSW